MINKYVRLISDFLAFKKLSEGFEINKLDDKLKLRIKESDSSFEKSINEVLLYNLARKMIAENISNDFAQGFKTALLLRANLKNLD